MSWPYSLPNPFPESIQPQNKYSLYQLNLAMLNPGSAQFFATSNILTKYPREQPTAQQLVFSQSFLVHGILSWSRTYTAIGMKSLTSSRQVNRLFRTTVNSSESLKNALFLGTSASTTKGILLNPMVFKNEENPDEPLLLEPGQKVELTEEAAKKFGIRGKLVFEGVGEEGDGKDEKEEDEDVELENSEDPMRAALTRSIARNFTLDCGETVGSFRRRLKEADEKDA